jgi:hypothetical protein
MRKDKETATEMRKTGKSYRQIKAALKIPVSTLSEWFSNEEWSKQIAQKLQQESAAAGKIRLQELDKIRGAHLIRAYEEAGKEAREDLERLKYNPLFIAGIMLYWGEGDKATPRSVRFTNSDPKMVTFYVHFLKNACGIPVEKIKANVLIYPDHEEMVTRAFWIQKTGLPRENFNQSVRIIGREKVRRLRWGVCNITISSSYFKVKMLEWINQLPDQLMNPSYYENIGQFAGK